MRSDHPRRRSHRVLFAMASGGKGRQGRGALIGTGVALQLCEGQVVRPPRLSGFREVFLVGGGLRSTRVNTASENKSRTTKESSVIVSSSAKPALRSRRRPKSAAVIS